jgi:hypothetical protein
VKEFISSSNGRWRLNDRASKCFQYSSKSTYLNANIMLEEEYKCITLLGSPLDSWDNSVV